MTFNRPWTTRDAQRTWCTSFDFSRAFVSSDIESHVDECLHLEMCWNCVDVSTMHVVRHDV